MTTRTYFVECSGNSARATLPQPAQVPAIQVDERSVSWERNLDSQPPMLRVSLAYTREVEYPYLDRTVTKVFELDLTNDLTAPNWGPGR